MHFKNNNFTHFKICSGLLGFESGFSVESEWLAGSWWMKEAW